MGVGEVEEEEEVVGGGGVDLLKTLRNRSMTAWVSVREVMYLERGTRSRVTIMPGEVGGWVGGWVLG